MGFVKLLYGPYQVFGVLTHRPQRLHGLIGCLTEQGYEIEIVPYEKVNTLEVEMKGRIIFRCDIRFLLFNLDCDDDVLCERIVNVILEATQRLYGDRNMPNHASVAEGKRYIQKLKTITTQGYLGPDVTLLYEVQEQYKKGEEAGGELTGDQSRSKMKILKGISGIIETYSEPGTSKIGRMKSTDEMRSLLESKSYEVIRSFHKLQQGRSVDKIKVNANAAQLKGRLNQEDDAGSYKSKVSFLENELKTTEFNEIEELSEN